MEITPEIKKIIIPVAGLGSRFFPLSLVLSKEFFPLVDKPVIQYIVEEARRSGISEIIFVVSPKQKRVVDYFKTAPDLKKLLEKRKNEKALKELEEFEKMLEGIKFSAVVQKNPLGDGHALLQAVKSVAGKPIAVSFGDDIIDADEPAILQLMNIFNTCQTPVIGLKSLPKSKIPAYGNVAVEKIANNLYKIKKIVEKPAPDAIESDLVIVGKYVLTPEVFSYLKKATPSKKGEIILGEVFEKMLEDGKTIYGYEVKGEWLECGDKAKWLKSFMYLALKDSVFGKELREYIKTLKI